MSGSLSFQTKVTLSNVKLYKIYDELCKLSGELFKKDRFCPS